MVKINKKIIGFGLIILAILLVLFPTLKSNQEIEETKQILQEYKDNRMIDSDAHIIKIDSIDLELPIKHGATHENMKSSVATMTHTKIKTGTNFTIAGHRNLRKGKNFNRLNEVEIGDIIQILNKEESFEFEVSDKFIVYPEDAYILEDSGETEVTLITCYPIGISNQRLVIKGILK